MRFGLFFFSSRRRHTRWPRDWSSDVCSSDLRVRRQQVVDDIGQRLAVELGAVAQFQRGHAGATAGARDRKSVVWGESGELGGSGGGEKRVGAHEAGLTRSGSGVRLEACGATR